MTRDANVDPITLTFQSRTGAPHGRTTPEAGQGR